MLDKTLTVVLAGGVGSRLAPLTNDRAKPAVPFGGKYRIIDFTLTNCLHSGLRRVLVLTQYKSHSLNKHIRDGWSVFNPELGEYITVVPPQMRTGDTWYAGTADAIYQNLYLLERSGAKWLLVLSGDHIYRMDYAPLLQFHRQVEADCTVAGMQVPLSEAGQFGVMQLGAQQRVTGFAEKPAQPAPLPERPDAALASMGIYVFSMEVVLAQLRADAANGASSHDFGKDILPSLIHSHRVHAYVFGRDEGRVSPDRYWRDVGTLDSFYQAHMDLLKPVPPMDLYQKDWPIRTYSGQHPPARTVPGASGTEGIAINSIVCSGVVIAGGSVQESVLFNNVTVEEEAMVENSLLFEGCIVGKGARLRRCIIDKNVQVPAGTSIGYDLAADRQRFTVSAAGVVVIPKGYRF